MLKQLGEFIQPQEVKCLRCGGAYFAGLDTGLCPACALYAHRIAPGDLLEGLEHREGLDWAGAAWRYGEGVRHRVYALKYGGERRLGDAMGRELAQVLQALPERPDALVPVPLHWTRRLMRGYNQAEEIARGMAAVFGCDVGDNLRALRRHSTQTRRSANERFTNISGSFAVVNPRELDGLNVVIVDDVITTGSTMADCIRAVGESSAPASINVLSLGATLLKA